MKQEKDDIELRNVLQGAYMKVGEDKWFTAKVLNRLPEKVPHYGWVETVVYAVALVMCALVWIYYVSTQAFDVITVRDLINLLVIVAVTVAVLIQTVRHIFVAD